MKYSCVFNYYSDGKPKKSYYKRSERLSFDLRKNYYVKENPRYLNKRGLGGQQSKALKRDIAFLIFGLGEGWCIGHMIGTCQSVLNVWSIHKRSWWLCAKIIIEHIMWTIFQMAWRSLGLHTIGMWSSHRSLAHPMQVVSFSTPLQTWFWNTLKHYLLASKY